MTRSHNYQDILTTKKLNLYAKLIVALETSYYQNYIRSKLTVSKSDALVYH